MKLFNFEMNYQCSKINIVLWHWNCQLYSL